MKSRITKKDVTLIVAVWLALLAGGLAAWSVFGAIATIPFAATAAAIILWQQFESVRRTSAQLTRMREEAFDDFRQIEALLSLFTTLKPEKSLPPTRDHSASPDLLQHMVSLINERRPALVLELGSGSSTVFLAYALKRLGHGRLISLDHEAAFADRTRSMVEQHGLSGVATVVHCPLTPVRIGSSDYQWYDTETLTIDSPIDMILIDGPPYHVHPLARYPAIPVLRSFMSSDASIVLDDAERPEELRIAEMWKKEFPDFKAESLDTEKGALLLTRSGVPPADSSGSEVAEHEGSTHAGAGVQLR